MLIYNFFCFVFLLMHDRPSSSAEDLRSMILFLKFVVRLDKQYMSQTCTVFLIFPFYPFLLSECVYQFRRKEIALGTHSSGTERRCTSIVLYSVQEPAQDSILWATIQHLLGYKQKRPKGMRTNIDKISRVPTKHST